MKFKPHDYQRRAQRHIEETPAAALFLDMGLGKTVVTLSWAANLINRLDLRGVLVIAPLRVIEMTWAQEAAKWNHTRWLRVVTVRGSAAERERILREPADIYLINYDLVIWLTNWLAREPSLNFDAVVFDESSKMKSPSARRFKLIKPFLGWFHRRLILTGTPAPNSYEDLWSQLYLLDEGARLGKYVTHFRDRFFELNPYNRFDRRIRKGAAATIENLIGDLVLCLKASDYLKMPKLIANRIEIELSEKDREDYDRLEREMFVELEKTSVEAFNAASLTTKCRQFSSGAIYDPPVIDRNGKPRPRTWTRIHDAKLDALAEIIDEAAGSPVLVAYEYQHELARLRERWPKAPWIGGGSKDSAKIVERWNRAEIPVLFAHPASIGHGINLQYGGHILAWLSGTFSLELYEQTVARLYRQGQKMPVIVHWIVARRTADEVAFKTIERKAKGQAALRDALVAYRDGGSK